MRDFIRSVSETLRFSSEDPRMVALSFAVAAIVFALLVLTIVAVWALIAARDEAGRREAGRGIPARVASRAGGRIALVAGLVVLFAYGLSVVHLSRSEVCVGCHSAYSKPSSASHRSVPCVSCHRQPGLTGFALWNLDYIRWYTVSLRSGDTPVRPSSRPIVTGSSCARCHSVVWRENVVTNGIRMRHVDVRHVVCVRCHPYSGHKAPRAASSGTPPVMSVCVECHDSKQVSGECESCHVGDIALAGGLRSPSSGATKISANYGPDCRGCHDPKRCTSCHGTEMPHPPGWTPSHARDGFVRKDVCWRCHPGADPSEDKTYPYAMCNECHRFPGPHGSSVLWIREHGTAALKQQNPPRNRSKCGLCHRNKEFCDLCHEGLRERYNYTP